MTSLLLECEDECICYICQDLLTENPESVPVPAKRSRRSGDQSPDSGPQPSTSSSGSFSSSSGGGENVTPELCTTPCGHIYHKLCLTDWIKRKAECPTCRSKVAKRKLTRVYLPLTPGQCRQCKERVNQVENARVDYSLAATRADECQRKEKEWMDRCIQLTQENEDVKETVSKQKDKIDELNAEVAAGKVEEMIKRQMLEAQEDFKLTIQQLEQDLKSKKQELLDKVDTEKVLKEECEQLKKDKEKLEMEVDRNNKVGDWRTEKDWQNLYRLAVLEKEKFRAARDFERHRANLYQEWGLRMKGGDKQSLAALVVPTASIPDLSVDLAVTDSEEENDETDDGGQQQQQLRRQESTVTITISDSDDDDDNDKPVELCLSSSSSSASSSDDENDSSSSDSESDVELDKY